MKVFFDTNIYAGEVLGGRACRAVQDTTVKSRWRVYTSRYLIDELSRVIVERLGLPARTARLAGQRVRRRATLVRESSTRHRVADDSADTPILRAALRAGVDFLVTNDRHLLSLDPYEPLRIVSLASYYRLLEDRGVL